MTSTAIGPALLITLIRKGTWEINSLKQDNKQNQQVVTPAPPCWSRRGKNVTPHFPGGKDSYLVDGERGKRQEWWWHLQLAGRSGDDWSHQSAGKGERQSRCAVYVATEWPWSLNMIQLNSVSILDSGLLKSALSQWVRGRSGQQSIMTVGSRGQWRRRESW